MTKGNFSRMAKKINPPVKIKSEILFYSTYDNAVIHLGIDKEEVSDYGPNSVIGTTYTPSLRL